MIKMIYFISIFFLLILLSISFLGTWRGWFIKPKSWISRIMHILGGFFTAMLASAYFGREFLEQTSFLKYFIIISGFTALIGILWEIAEYIFGIYKFRKSGAKKYMTEINDTIEDLFLDILGAGVWIAIFIFA